LSRVAKHFEKYHFLPSQSPFSLNTREVVDHSNYSKRNKKLTIYGFYFKKNHYITDERIEIFFLGGSMEALEDRLPELLAPQLWDKLKTFLS
jgi:hypothetical protein